MPNQKMLNLNLAPIVEPVFALKALHLYKSSPPFRPVRRFSDRHHWFLKHWKGVPNPSWQV